MVFGSKPKKPNSVKPGDKRCISLLNSDFKVITGVETARIKKVATHTLSPLQLVAGDNRRIHHGINKARDAITASAKIKGVCALVDTDYLAAFDWMVMKWVFMVLAKKGMSDEIIKRYKNLYEDNISTIVVNNVMGRSINNIRLSLRQGDTPSMFWFAYGIDPLLYYLDKRLTGIPIYSLPVLGPVKEEEPPLAPITEVYKLVAYADDVKPAVRSMEAFVLIDKACELFE